APHRSGSALRIANTWPGGFGPHITATRDLGDGAQADEKQPNQKLTHSRCFAHRDMAIRHFNWPLVARLPLRKDSQGYQAVVRVIQAAEVKHVHGCASGQCPAGVTGARIVPAVPGDHDVLTIVAYLRGAVRRWKLVCLRMQRLP